MVLNSSVIEYWNKIRKPNESHIFYFKQKVSLVISYFKQYLTL